MLFEQGIYRMDIDLEHTRAWYESQKTDPKKECDCAGCRNYRAAIDQLHGAVRDFLAGLGIDPRFPAEMSALCSKDGIVGYDGWFHICGTILEGKEPFVEVAPKRRQLNPIYRMDIGGECNVFFREEAFLVDKDFPEPVIQMEINFTLPWVLEEADPYIYS